MNAESEFEVLLSFAGPERVYARAIHAICSASGIRTFLDEEFQHEIWGKNLVEYLDEMYRERGAFCVVLISHEYCERAYTKVERRAAFDRMIQQAGEYLLPVRVDDAWPQGLPKATAHLDLRIQGVVGVCESLVRKIRGPDAKLTIPDDVHVPRIPMGQVKAEHLLAYLNELCRKQPVSLFGAFIYDEGTAELRKILSDTYYWDALDQASGPDFEIFALRDREEFEVERTMEMLTIASLSRSRSRGYYFSRLLKEYFGKEKAKMEYPSLLLFLTANGSIRYCSLIPFERGTTEETFRQLQNLVSLVAKIVAEWKASALQDIGILRNELKDKLLDADYRLKIQRPPVKVEDALEGLRTFVESEPTGKGTRAG
jgi:hypothetical protein